MVAGSPVFKDFQAFGRGASQFANMDMEYFRYWSDATQTTLVYDWDANSSDTSNTGVQPVLTETVSANDATGVNFPTDGSAWGGVAAGITVTATETLNAYSDSITADIDYNVSANITETLSSYSDSASIEFESLLIGASVTETLNSYQDSSITDVTGQIDVSVTETLNSYSDSVTATIAKQIDVQVTELLSSYSDSSAIKLPANWVIQNPVSTNWNEQSEVSTNWNEQSSTTTIWTIKG